MEIVKILEQYGIQTEKCAFQTVLGPTLGRTGESIGSGQGRDCKNIVKLFN